MKETKKAFNQQLADSGSSGTWDYRTGSIFHFRGCSKQIGIIAAIAIVLNIITIVVNMKYSFGILNLSSTVSAILFSVAFVYGFASQLDPLGWAVSGLYTWGQVAGFLVFAVLTFAALILEFVVSFKGLVKQLMLKKDSVSLPEMALGYFLGPLAYSS